MALQQELVRKRLELRGKKGEQLLAVSAELRAATLVERAILAFQQLNAQAFGSDGDLNLFEKFLELLLGLNLLFEPLLKLLKESAIAREL